MERLTGGLGWNLRGRKICVEGGKMGDSNRNVVFAQFIQRQFRKAKSVLVVGDGRGELARKLANKGFSVRVIEARPRFEGREHKKIDYREGWFSRDTLILEDVVVGMHPDEATAEIIIAAERQKKGWAVVPCCLRGLEARGVQDFAGWLKKLAMLGTGCRKTCLPMTGKNVVLWKCR